MKLYLGTFLFNFTLIMDRIVIQPSDSDRVWNILFIIMYSFGILIINTAIAKNIQDISEIKTKSSDDRNL